MPATLKIPQVSRVLVFHKLDSAAATSASAVDDLLEAFPKPSSLLWDLKTASAHGVAASYVARADRADGPLVFKNLGITLGYADKRTVAALRRKSVVASVVAAPRLGHIRPVRVAAAALDTPRTWGIEALGVKQLWDQGLTGKDVYVGHLDTGVDGKHPALKSRIADFAEWDTFGRKMPSSSPHDSAMHGTHTAGTICGVAVAGKSVGIAPGALICSGLVIEGGDTTARILGGLDWLVGLGVRIVSLSLGYPGYTPVFSRLIDILVGRNILPVFAIGNEGPNTSRSPGNYPDSLSVGAVDEKLHTPPFSGSQHFARKRNPDKPDCVAPGVAVISAKPGGGWQEMDGTSMATPHVAGVAALLAEAAPSATAADLRNAILSSCNPLTGEPPLRFGRGFVRAPQALASLTGSAPGRVSSSPVRPSRRKRARKRR